MPFLVSWSKKWFPPLPHSQQLFFLEWTCHQNISITGSILATQSEESEQTTGRRQENNRIKLELVSEWGRRHSWKYWLETEMGTLFFTSLKGFNQRSEFCSCLILTSFTFRWQEVLYNYIVRMREVICWPKSHSKSSEIKVFWLFYPVNFLLLFSSTIT